MGRQRKKSRTLLERIADVTGYRRIGELEEDDYLSAPLLESEEEAVSIGVGTPWVTVEPKLFSRERKKFQEPESMIFQALITIGLLLTTIFSGLIVAVYYQSQAM